MTGDRYERGRAKRAQLLGEQAEQGMSYFKVLAPDLDRIIVADMFGGMLSGSELDQKTRSLCIVSMLATMAGREVQLKYHIGGALNVGVTKAEIVEALKQVFFFAGLPAAATGLKVAEGVFSERDL